MRALVWFVIVCCLVGVAITLWLHARRLAARRRDAEARAAALVAEAAEAMRARAKAPAPDAPD